MTEFSLLRPIIAESGHGFHDNEESHPQSSIENVRFPFLSSNSA